MYSNSGKSIAYLISAVVLIVPLRATATDIREQVREATKGFRDLSATMVATYANKGELRKMGRDFAQSYEFETAEMVFKNPNKLKMSGKVGLVRVDFIITGEVRIIRVPSLRISKRDSLADDPRKHRTPLDVGVLADGVWREYDVKLESERVVDGRKEYVLSLTRKGTRQPQRLWIDAETLRPVQREKYDDSGRLAVRFEYVDAQKIDGIWVPRKIKAYSPSGKLAGVTEYRNIKVNSGVPDSEFQ